MRRPILAGNWKMNLGRPQEALEFVRAIRHPLNQIEHVDRVICPPFTALHAVADALAGTAIGLGAQNMHWQVNGAQTGEISPPMLQEICQYVIVGHSERRATGSSLETNASTNHKLRGALEHGLTPIVCVGENLDQKQRGETDSFVQSQVLEALDGLSAEQVVRCVIAYEPIWAIGTGMAATPVDANRLIALSIRGPISAAFGEATAQLIRVQYGGSVTPDNIVEFMAMPEIDGALVGGASLKPDFVDLVRRAAGTPK
ncbi:MAG: triose-phosphate isomerase [Anaerolineales bacterium]|nr:triose-phosphate isomerase [Anaerolineales bacterium]